jgi:hypothetical protein
MLTVLVGLSQFYSDSLSAETKKGKAERKRQGFWNGLLPFGVTTDARGIPCLDRTVRYCDVETRREIVPGEGMLLAYELAAGGQSDREIARALNGAGYRTSGNRGMNRWTKDSVRPMLQNRFYVGELPDGEGGWLPARHGVLIDPANFHAAQDARLRNATRPRRVKTEKRSPWALSGLATCACGATMTAYGHASGRQRVQCSRRTQTKDCDAPTFYASVVEEQIGAFLGGFGARRRAGAAGGGVEGTPTQASESPRGAGCPPSQAGPVARGLRRWRLRQANVSGEAGNDHRPACGAAPRRRPGPRRGRTTGHLSGRRGVGVARRELGGAQQAGAGDVQRRGDRQQNGHGDHPAARPVALLCGAGERVVKRHDVWAEATGVDYAR